MTDPMSMLDWGLYQAGKTADEATDTLNDDENKALKFATGKSSIKWSDFVASKQNKLWDHTAL